MVPHFHLEPNAISRWMASSLTYHDRGNWAFSRNSVSSRTIITLQIICPEQQKPSSSKFLLAPLKATILLIKKSLPFFWARTGVHLGIDTYYIGYNITNSGFKILFLVSSFWWLPSISVCGIVIFPCLFSNFCLWITKVFSCSAIITFPIGFTHFELRSCWAKVSF